MRRLPLLLLLAGALPAQAGLFDDEEARARIEKLRQEFAQHAQQVNGRLETLGKNQLDFANQVEALRNDLSRLRGQAELLINDMEATQKRQRDFYVDLDNRLRKLETAASEARPADPAPAETPKVDPAAELRDYEAALNAFKSAKYREALNGFSTFIKAHPASNLQASAHYWAASSHFQLKEYAPAAQLFGHMAGAWPADARAADALLGQANALAATGDLAGSRRALEAILARYPQSSAADAARQRLKGAPAAKKK